MEVRELIHKRVKIWEQAKELLGKAETEKRDLTAEERSQWEKMNKDMDDIDGDIKRLERTLAHQPQPEVRTEPQGAVQTGTVPQTKTVELRSSFGSTRNVTIPWGEVQERQKVEWRNYLLGGPRFVGEELRALQKDIAVSGGYLSAPVQFQAELIQDKDNLVFMRKIARVLPPITSAETLGAPSLDTDVSDATWTTEIATGSADSSLALGKRELTPHPLAKYIKVSNTLLRRSQLSADALVRQRLAYKVAVPEENAFLNGSGSGQPLGVFTASANGISTGRDVSTGNTTTEIRFDGLIEAEMSLTAANRVGLSWVFHRTAIKQIRKLKDGEGRYVWQPSVVAGQPNTLLTYPLYESEYAPSTFQTGLYVGILGNFSQYWIVDALTMTIQVVDQLYAATNETAYFIRLEADGMPVMENAFARVKLA